MRRRSCTPFLAAILPLLGVTWLLAAQASRPAIPEQASAGAIAGVVTDAETGLPLMDVEVKASAAGPNRTVKTGVDGRYLLERVAAGTYAVFPIKEGYGHGMAARPRRIRVDAERKVENVNFALRKEGVIAGRAFDVDKKPVKQARVMAWVREYARGREEFSFRGGARTDDLGEFRITGLREGRYYLAVFPPTPGFRSVSIPDLEDRQLKWENIPTFYPGVPATDGAQAILLGPGEQREAVDLAILKEKTFCVAGAIRDAEGEVVQLALNDASSVWDATIASGPVQENKDFVVCGLPRGSYSLSATTVNSAGHSIRFGRVHVQVANRNLRLPPIQLSAATQLPGRISVTGLQQGMPAPSGFEVYLMPNHRYEYVNAMEGVKIDTAPAEFIYGNRFPDEYWLHVRVPAGTYVKKATCGFLDAMREPVRPGCGELNIVIGADAAAVSGTVTDADDHPVSDGAVVLMPNPLPVTLSPDAILSTFIDQDGRFEFRGVAPRKYRVIAFSELESGQEQDPAFVREWHSRAVEVSLSPGERSVLNTKAIQQR